MHACAVFFLQILSSALTFFLCRRIGAQSAATSATSRTAARAPALLLVPPTRRSESFPRGAVTTAACQSATWPSCRETSSLARTVSSTSALPTTRAPPPACPTIACCSDGAWLDRISGSTADATASAQAAAGRECRRPRHQNARLHHRGATTRRRWTATGRHRTGARRCRRQRGKRCPCFRESPTCQRHLGRRCPPTPSPPRTPPPPPPPSPVQLLHMPLLAAQGAEARAPLAARLPTAGVRALLPPPRSQRQRS